MAQLFYRRHRFPASIIQHAIWLYLYADRIDGSIGTPSAERAEGCAPASTQEGMRPMPGHLIRSMPYGRGGSRKACLRRSRPPRRGRSMIRRDMSARMAQLLRPRVSAQANASARCATGGDDIS